MDLVKFAEFVNKTIEGHSEEEVDNRDLMFSDAHIIFRFGINRRGQKVIERYLESDSYSFSAKANGISRTTARGIVEKFRLLIVAQLGVSFCSRKDPMKTLFKRIKQRRMYFKSRDRVDYSNGD